VSGFICIVSLLLGLQFLWLRKTTRRVRLQPLLGYTLVESFFIGDTVPIFVHAEFACTGTLYRLSNELESIGVQFENYANLQSNQFHPTRGFDWKNPISISTDGLKSGYYYLKLSASDGVSSTTYIPFILKRREPSEITIVASTNTWHAYNHFGGKSNYIDRRWGALERAIEFIFYVANYITRGLIPSWPVYLPTARPYSWIGELDHQTHPENPTEFSHLLRSEWNLAAFMDARGCDYTVISDRDFQNNSGYASSKLIIFNTHSEYWSNEMLARLETLQQTKGINIFFASGNNAFRMVEYYDHGVSVTNQFSDIPTVTRLTGAYYTKAGYLGFAPYRIEAPDHWMFENTNLRPGDLFGTKSMWTMGGAVVGGASGYETDKIFPCALSCPKVLAVGSNPSGPAYWVIQETSERFTINVGSVGFMGSLPVDPVIQRILTTILLRAECSVKLL